MPTMRHAVLDGFAVHILTHVKVKAHWHDGKVCGMFSKEEEITSPPPAVTELEAEDSNW